MSWKSTLPSYTLRGDIGSKYSSDDKVPRFGSITAPSSYRPSYSIASGTYRSVPIKKNQPVETVVSTRLTDTKKDSPLKLDTKDVSPNKYLAKKYETSKEPDTTTKYSSLKDLSTPQTSKYKTSKDGNASTSTTATTTTSTPKYGSTRNLTGSLSSLNSTPTTARSKYSVSKENISSKYDTSPSTSSTTSKKEPKKYGSTKDLSTSSTASDSAKSSTRYGNGASYTGRSTKKDDGPPITYNTRYGKNIATPTTDRSSRIASREPSPANTRKPLSVARPRSRDPSPIDLKLTNMNFIRVRSRDPSPANDSKLALIEARCRSRGTSPNPTEQYRITNEQITEMRDKYNPAAYKPYTRSNTASESSSSISKLAPVLTQALSYLTAREASVSRASSVSRTPSVNKYISPEPPSMPAVKKDIITVNTTKPKIETTTNDSTEEEDSSEYEEIEIEVEVEEEEEEEEEEEPIEMITVNVTTRGTSPTYPSPNSSTSSSYSRARRIDIAKTIEKTIQRTVKRPLCVDKSIQSDRMDDTTRYSRFSNTSTRLAQSSYLDSKYPSNYSRYSSSPRYTSSRETSISSSRNSERDKSELQTKSTDSEKKGIRTPLNRSRENLDTSKSSSTGSMSRSNSIKNLNKSNSSSDAKSKSPPSNGGDKKRCHLPMSPKAESPSKTISTTSSAAVVKWPNKDFRKSTLNMGSPERSRGTRSDSTGTEPEENTKNTQSNHENSPTVESESSTTTSGSSKSSKISITKSKTQSKITENSDKKIDQGNSSNVKTSSSPPQSSSPVRTEAKSFLIRTLGPVTNFFKPRVQESPEKHWIDSTSTTSVSESLKLDSEPLRYAKSNERSDSETRLHGEPTTTFNLKLNKKDCDSKGKWWISSGEDSSPKKESVHLSNGVASKPHTPEVVRINLHRIESGEPAWWVSGNNSNGSTNGEVEKAWWQSSSDSSKQACQQKSSPSRDVNSKQQNLPFAKNTSSGESPWWMHNDVSNQSASKATTSHMDSKYETDDDELQSMENTFNQVSTEIFDLPPLGDRASPEGLEDTMSDRKSIYDNVSPCGQMSRSEKLFISRHTNIDDILGGTCHALGGSERKSTNELLNELAPTPAVWNQEPGTIRTTTGYSNESRDTVDCSASLGQDHHKKLLDDAAIQVYKDGDYGPYLDLESSLAEQAEETEGINATSRKNSLVVRTQLSVRVHAIIEKLLTSEGRELRRALFSLKQIFQEDKDLVHGFVALGGLNCLVRVGSNADQNFQNYILRALGQVMLYVDGMNGVMKHGPTIQWLYSLIASKYRIVVKTALKLLLVFIEYIETNSALLVNAIHTVDSGKGLIPWSNIMRLLKDYDNADSELLIYASSLINKTLAGLKDQDSFYDESDLLEQQGMEEVVQRYTTRSDTDLDLLDQLQLYEAVLKYEDGETDALQIPDSTLRETLRYRAPVSDSNNRRKSRRHSTGTAPPAPPPIPPPPKQYSLHNSSNSRNDDEDSSSSQNSTEFSGVLRDCRDKTPREDAGVTPGLRRRRERAERQKSFMREQEAVNNGTQLAFNAELTNGQGNQKSSIPLINRAHKNNLIEKIPEIITTTTPTNVITSNQNSINIITNNNNINNSNHQPIMNQKNQHHCDSNLNNNLLNDKFNQRLSNNNKLILSTNNNNNNINGGSLTVKPVKIIVESNLSVDDLNKKNEMMANGIANGIPKSRKLIDEIENQSDLINSNSNNGNHRNGIIGNQKNCEIEFTPLKQLNNNNNSILTKVSNLNVSRGNNSLKEQELVTDTNGWDNHIEDIEKVTNGNGLVEHENGTTTNGNDNQFTIKTNGTNDYKLQVDSENEDKKLLLQLKRDHTVKDLTHKLSNLPLSPTQEDKQNRIGDMSGLISKAKESLAKSKSKGDIPQSPTVDSEFKKSPEPKKSENELHWEELIKNMTRPLTLCDLDFTDLSTADENDITAARGKLGVIPPPPPAFGMPPMMPPPMMNMPPPMMNFPQPPPLSSATFTDSNKSNGDVNSIKKNKKTVKLFWKEVREDMVPVTIGQTIWDELPKSTVDTQKLEHLFESRAKDFMTKKQQELNKNKEIIVLDHKRSNAINIAMTKLPAPRAIKAAILKMDATVVSREGIDKLLNMLPTDEERGKIQEAQMLHPELPLGSAENFLLTLSSISELAARLKLWAFKLDFENIEKEIAEPLMDLKQGIELLTTNKTFKAILSTLLSIGIFLNGVPVKGFQVEYLAKVPEVKDTVHKHSLLHHLCHMIMETKPDTTDLYSEIGPITRASKTDFGELAHNIIYLETECKASWDRLKLIAKHDCPPQLKQKMFDFLSDCAERIIILDIVHRRIINRYRKFLLWLGTPQHRVAEFRPNEFCRIVSEFALEYRTTRERVQQQFEKKASHRERNKTRGKMIIDVSKFKAQEDSADAELRQILGSPNTGPGSTGPDGIPQWRRKRSEQLMSPRINRDESFTDGDDEILESLVKSATKSTGPRRTPRERKRIRQTDRKSLRRTLKNGLTEEERQHVATFIKGY